MAKVAKVMYAMEIKFSSVHGQQLRSCKAWIMCFGKTKAPFSPSTIFYKPPFGNKHLFVNILSECFGTFRHFKCKMRVPLYFFMYLDAICTTYYF